MPDDSYFITFIAERVYRGTCLTFYLTGDRKRTGWITGIDMTLFSYVGTIIKLFLWQQIPYHRIWRVYDRRQGFSPHPFKINDIKGQTMRESVLSYTKKVREKAEEFKKNK